MTFSGCDHEKKSVVINTEKMHYLWVLRSPHRQRAEKIQLFLYLAIRF